MATNDNQLWQDSPDANQMGTKKLTLADLGGNANVQGQPVAQAPDYSVGNQAAPAAAAAPAGSGKGEGYDRAAAYYQSKGVTPYDTSLDSWNNYWNEWGSKDPTYFDQRLAQADEFTGKGPNYDWTKDPANASMLGAQSGGRVTGASNVSNLSGYTQASAPGFEGSVLAGAPGSPDAGALFKTLMRRANQGEVVDPNDPIIRNQVNAYDASQVRSARTAEAQAAEAGGQHANPDAVVRSANEKASQNTAGFQANLMANELTARRQEIAQALAGAQGFLTAQQQMQLQEELAKMDYQLRQYQFGSSQGQQESQFARDLAERGYEYDTTDQFRNSPLYGG